MISAHMMRSCSIAFVVIATAVSIYAQDKVHLAAAPSSGSVATNKEAEPAPTETSSAAQPATSSASQSIPAEPDDGKPQVRLVGMETDIAKRYLWTVPALPVPPFTRWRQWFLDHEVSVHCALEWRNDEGKWQHAELRSSHFDLHSEQYKVGAGEFPGTAYDAYGVYIIPGRLPRDKDVHGRPMVITLDEKIDCDCRAIEREIRHYAAKDARPGAPGTGGRGEHNVGLGGPAYKPSQNSNTMVKYVLRACGINHAKPDRAIGWETEPLFPYSSDADAPAMDNRP